MAAEPLRRAAYQFDRFTLDLKSRRADGGRWDGAAFATQIVGVAAALCRARRAPGQPRRNHDGDLARRVRHRRFDNPVCRRDPTCARRRSAAAASNSSAAGLSPHLRGGARREGRQHCIPSPGRAGTSRVTKVSGGRRDRAPAADRAVLRPGRARPRSPSGWIRRTSARSSVPTTNAAQRRLSAPAAMSPNTWVMGYSLTSATRRPMRMMPNAQCVPDSLSSQRPLNCRAAQTLSSTCGSE